MTSMRSVNYYVEDMCMTAEKKVYLYEQLLFDTMKIYKRWDFKKKKKKAFTHENMKY